MTQVAKMILNELPISPTISEKIEFIKSSKLDFKDFNNFRLLLNSLESFEPSSKLSPKEYKAQINRRIGAFLERLDILEKKIKSTQEHKSDKAKYFHLLAEIETFANKTKQDSQILGELLEKTSEFLLSAENLNDNEMDTLEKVKESLQEYFIHLKQNENERQESQSNEIAQNISDESQKDLPQNNIRFDESARILMVGDEAYCMGTDGFVRKISNYGSENQFCDKSQKLNPKDLSIDDGHREYLERIGINVDEIFKMNEKSQDSNPQHTMKTSLFDDEEVKPQKKRMS